MFFAVKLVAASADNAPAYLRDLSTTEAYNYQVGASSIWLRKRESYPVTFARLDSNNLVFGYGEQSDNHEDHAIEEFLNCALDWRKRTFQLERDVFCTLPLFYYADREICLISDDLEWILTECSRLTLDKAALANLLIRPHISEKTLFTEVQLLTERMELLWANGQLSLKRLVIKPYAATHVRPADFKTRLETTFDKYWRLAEHEMVAFEISGGIDSATMPLYISKRHSNFSVCAGGMNFIEGFGATQARKLQDLSDYIGFQVMVSPIDKQRDYPLARFFAPVFNPAVFYQYQEIYTEALSRLAALFKEQGVTLVFTGIGGDELFEENVNSLIEQVRFPNYLTSKAHSELHTTETRSVIRMMADSAFYANQSRNRIYIDNGIWPISPLSDPQLLAYCRKLGPVHKSNKNVLRAYHEAANFPESIYGPVQNEHFGRFFEDSIKENYGRVLRLLRQHSVLAGQGLVNWERLIDIYDAARWREQGGADLFAVFRLATAEIILQAALPKLRGVPA